MDPIRSSLPSRTYEDFVPPSDWIREEGFDMLLMELPGFRKEQLKVQLDNFGNLRTFGERPLDGNRHRRFRKEFRLPDNCNTSEIRAKFEDGILTVTVPKPTTSTHAEPAIPTPPPPARAESPATAKPPPPAPRAPPRDEPTLPAPQPRHEPTIPTSSLPPPPPPRDEPTFVTPPPPTKTTTPEPQAMPKQSEPTKENDGGKVDEVKEETMEAMREEEEEANYDETGGLAVGMKRKRKQLLVVNIVVAAVLLVGVGLYVAYKFKKAAEAGTTKGLLHYEL